MKSLLVFIVLLATIATHAQFVNSLMPFKQSDFKAIKAGGYTKCSVYEMVGKEKILVKEAEYGKEGMVATLYEKGINNAGDSISTSTVYYKFDGKGKLIQETYEVAPGEDGESSLTGYTYNAAGKLVTKIIAHIDPPTYTYKYDATGKLKQINVTLRMPSFDEEEAAAGKAVDVPWNKYMVKCNASGQVIEEKEYTLRGEDKNTPIGSYFWQYNAAGNITKYTYKSFSGDNQYTIAYTYNKAGLLTTSTETKTGEKDKKFTYDYCKTCVQSWMK